LWNLKYDDAQNSTSYRNEKRNDSRYHLAHPGHRRDIDRLDTVLRLYFDNKWPIGSLLGLIGIIVAYVKKEKGIWWPVCGFALPFFLILAVMCIIFFKMR